jgi:hypothetical protein
LDWVRSQAHPKYATNVRYSGNDRTCRTFGSARRALRDRPTEAWEGVVKRLVLTLVALLIALPTAVDAAQGDDNAYRAPLAAMYRRYVQNGPGKRFDVEASVALDDCGKAKAATAIPVLEKKLRESGFSLPEEFKP